MASKIGNIHADDALVIGAVVVSAGILLLVYSVKQDVASGISQGYHDITSLPGKVIDAVASGAKQIYNGVGDFVSGNSGRPSDTTYPTDIVDQQSYLDSLNAADQAAADGML